MTWRSHPYYWQSEQALFNGVARALIRQGRPSVGEGGCCRYRGPAGLKCAAGHVIADEHYYRDLEGPGIYSWEVWRVLRKSGVPIGLHNLLGDLQLAHDANSAEEDFLGGLRKSLRRIAKERGLSTAVLEEKP